MYKNEINLGIVDSKTVRISIDETTTLDDLKKLISVFAQNAGKNVDHSSIFANAEKVIKKLDNSVARHRDLLNQDIFNKIHSEHQMLRYLNYLSTKDISLTRSMISLGSCTMKLNSTTEMVIII
jgi:glycine dehydrogenase